MQQKNIVFIARSLDGYIADQNGSIDWLTAVPNPGNDDLGYQALMAETDAIVMGRTTFETVLGFDIDWPYTHPVFVLSSTLQAAPDHLREQVIILSGHPREILDHLHQHGFFTLYIDGGSTLQRFLQADLIDELRLTTLPILLGGGFPLFGSLPHPLQWEHLSTRVYLDQLVQSCYGRKRG